MTTPGSSQLMKVSCFSAVAPVMGRNQWVKWVAPCSRAHSFMAVATPWAISGVSCRPCLRQWRKALNTSLGRRSRMVRSLKVLQPKKRLIFI